MKILPWLVRREGASALPVITSCLPWALAGWASLVGVLGRREVLKQRSSGFCYIGSESASSSIGQGIVCMELGVPMLQLPNCLFGLWREGSGRKMCEWASLRYLPARGQHAPSAWGERGFPQGEFLAWLLLSRTQQTAIGFSPPLVIFFLRWSFVKS